MNLCLSGSTRMRCGRLGALTGVAEVLNWEGPDKSEDFIFFFMLVESDESCFASNVKPGSGAELVTFQGRCLVAVGEKKKVGVLSNSGVSLHCMSRPAGDKHLTESVGGGRVWGCRRSVVIAHVELQQTLRNLVQVNKTKKKAAKLKILSVNCRVALLYVTFLF